MRADEKKDKVFSHFAPFFIPDANYAYESCEGGLWVEDYARERRRIADEQIRMRGIYG